MAKKNIWVVIEGEPLPGDVDKARLYRSGQIAQLLAKRGNEVCLISSTTNHMTKTKRSKGIAISKISENLKMILLDSPLYKSNVSFKRILHNIIFARNFKKFASKAKKPDVIISSYPPIEICKTVCEYGEKNNISTILDARDMWPDIFTRDLPAFLMPLGSLLLFPFELQAKTAFKKATKITGISDSFVEWAIEKTGPSRTNNKGPAFYLAYNNQRPENDSIIKANEFWDTHDIKSKSEQFIICMMGNIGYGGEIDVLIKAAQKLPNHYQKKIKVVICGTGMAFNEFKKMADPYPHIIMPGWMGKAQIWTLLQRSSAGALPYLSDYAGLNMAFPNKVGEYLSAGLPIISSLHGDLSNLLERENCGITYPNQGVDNLCEIMMDFADNPEKLDKMSENASQVFAKNFDSEIVYNNYCDFIEDTAQKNKKLLPSDM